MTRTSPTLFSAPRKAITSLAAICVVAGTVAIAPTASASSQLVEKKLTVKISMSELSKADGIEKAYAKLQEKAESYCEKDSTSLDFLGETVKECVEDLMKQFIATSKAAPLKAYHAKVAEMTVVEKFAEN